MARALGTTPQDTFGASHVTEDVSAATDQRFGSILQTMLRTLGDSGANRTLEVADIGCGAGTQCQMWAQLGHSVHGLDISESLVEIARKGAEERGLHIDFQVGSAVALPWRDASMDVCLACEILEHVPDWESCLDECARILRPGGVLYIGTSNKLCPVQQEFNLPLYSWYPRQLKRHYERLAATTRPELANHTEHPAVNWFSFYQLRDALRTRGLRSLDRFDVTTLHDKGPPARTLIRVIRHSALIRWLGHVATPSTRVVAIKI